MTYSFDKYAVEEEEWEIVTADWWRMAFTSVSWSYPPKKHTTDPKLPRNQFHGSLFSGLLSGRRQVSREADSELCSWSTESGTHDEDNTLNLDLIGLVGALGAVAAYEKDVGFSYTSFPTIEPHELALCTQTNLLLDVDEDALLSGRERWDELVEDLMNGPVFENHNTDSDGSLESSFTGSLSSNDLHRSTSTLSSIDLNSSEGSVDSYAMPTTPKAKHSFANVEVKGSSPNGSINGIGNYSSHPLSPGKALNASASSFVPNLTSQLYEEPLQFPSLIDSSKSPSNAKSPPSFANFTFPTLNAPHSSTAVKINKDDQGFFSEVQIETSLATGSTTDLLPPFLQEPAQRTRARKSRTREIVDRLRLRSQASPSESSNPTIYTNGISLSPKYASHSPSPICEDQSFLKPRLSVSEDGGDRPSGLSSPSVEEDDGWIDTTQACPTSPTPKTKRTRELFLALTRRRTDSMSSENIKELVASEGGSRAARAAHSSTSPSPSPHTPPLSESNDGWIESTTTTTSPPSLSRKKPKSHPASTRESHNSKKSSNHVSRASTSTSSSTSHFPFSATSAYYPTHTPSTSVPHIGPQAIPYFFPAYPTIAMPVPYTAFMHVPTYPMGIPLHGHQVTTANGVAAAYPLAAAQQYMTSMMPARGASSKSFMTSNTTNNMNMTPAYRAKHSPLW
ncbi:hypothetical protein B0H34DRAFT_700779 [Crassisporium funariophilum]|nr:hypothetical protein B0H34DRAFT_700779 [Crassisporium funariophilum]